MARDGMRSRADSVKLPCECGGEGVRNIGIRGYCWFHLQKLLSTFTTITMEEGFGLPIGGAEDVGGARLYPLQCVVCEASWMGDPLEACWYCQRQLEIALEWQRELVLKPPECELTDKQRPDMLRAWAARLAVQVEAGTITKEEAKNAIDREQRRTR